MSEDEDRVLRASVPDRWKGCTSPIGAVQSYIAELEDAVAFLRTRIETGVAMLEGDKSLSAASARAALKDALVSPQPE